MQEHHNLNVDAYSFEELLDLFDIHHTDFSLDELKMAKKKVLMTHPDKSKLSPEYFLFYKKAFDLLAQFFKDKQKIKQSKIDNSIAKYEEFLKKNIHEHEQILNSFENEEKFRENFNEMFEKNTAMFKPNHDKNEWFHRDEPDPLYQMKQTVTPKNMGAVLETVKQQTQTMVKYGGVQCLRSSVGGATSCEWNGLGEHEALDENNDYVSCDLFSKLKFDDLRKVHKEQTVSTVSETDYEKCKSKYSSLDKYNRERNDMQHLKPSRRIGVNIAEEQLKLF